MSEHAPTPTPNTQPSVKEVFEEEFAQRATQAAEDRQPLPDFGQDYNTLRTMAGVPELRDDNHFISNEEIAKRTGIKTVEALMAAFGGVPEVPTPSEPEPPSGDDPEADPNADTIDDSAEAVTRQQLTRKLTEAQLAYAKRTAKSRRSYLGRFAQGTTRVGRALLKIPGVEKVVEATNNHFDTKTESAKEAYEEAFNKLGAQVAHELQELGYNEEQIRNFATTGIILRSHKLEQMIVGERKGQSKDSNKFVNWWVNAQGIKGKLAKAGIVAGAGVAAGLTAGLALPALGIATGAVAGVSTSAIAGGAAGGGIARHVTRRRAHAVVDGKNIAAGQARLDHTAVHKAAYTRYENDEFGQVSDITDRVEKRTNAEMLGNRRRMKAAIAIGQVAGGLSGLGLNRLREALEGDGLEDTSTNSPKDATTPPEVEVPDPSVTPEHIDTTGFDYPWDWAEHTYGQGNGGNALYELSNKARAAGHDVQWHGSGTEQWVQVDGFSDTQTVVNILSKYR